MKGNNDKSIAIRGGMWTGLSTLVTMSTQILRLVILTRYLAKEDFGVVSITNTVIALCLYFTDLGFASAIMYKSELSKKEFSTLYWMQAILFTTIFFVLIYVSPYIASYYHNALIKSLVTVSGVSLIGQAIGKLYDSVLLKCYRFKALAVRNIITSVISLVVAWIMAANGMGAYSLVYSTITQILLINIWNFVSGCRYQPIGMFLDLKDALPLIKIGIFQTGTHILDFLSNKLDVVIIGRILGMEALGVYDLAKELVLKFIQLIKTVVSKVALPMLSNNNNDDNVVKQRFLSLTKLIAHICIPICVTLAIFSKEVVRIMYGENYLEATPIVTIFAVLTMVSCIASFFDMLGIAKGRTDLNFKQTVSRILITTPMVLLTSYMGIICVAWGQLIVGLISLTLFWFIVVKNTYPIPFKNYISHFGKTLIIMSCIGIVVGFIKASGVMAFFNNWVYNMLVYIGLYLVIIILSLPLLYPEYKFLYNLIKTRK